MARMLLLAVAAAPLIWAGGAHALPVSPLAQTSNVTEVRTVCDQYGRCCATGSGVCYYPARPRRQYYAPPRYYAPPAYGYRQRYYDEGPRYGGPTYRFGW